MNQGIANQGESARKNQVEVLNFLHRNGLQSRVDIAAHIRLTKATVTNLINEMLREGLLVERGELPSDTPRQRGRRKTMLDINENYRLVFGITLGGEQLRVGLTNLKGEVLSRSAVPLEGCGYRERLEAIVAQIEQLSRDNCITPDLLLGAGICLDRGGEEFVEGATLAEKLRHLKKDLSRALAFPLVTTTTCIGALAAQTLLADRRAGSLLLLRYGQEVGSAVLVNGAIHHGASGRAGGFAALLEQGADRSADEADRRLRQAIETCAAVLDPEKIVVFGDHFEEEGALDRIGFRAEHSPECRRLVPAVVTEETSFLAGSAAAIAACFYRREL